MVCNICGSNNTQLILNTLDYQHSKKLFSIRECIRCKTRLTHPVPEKLDAYYDKKNYDSYSTRNDYFGKLYSLVQKINCSYKVALIKKHGGSGLLDYGSGSGYFVGFANQKGLDAVGYEPINNAKVKNVYKNLKNIKRKNFNVITLWHVLEHTKDPLKLLVSLKKKLRGGGKIFIALPNYDSYDNIKYKKYWAGYDVPRHLYHFNKHSFTILAKKAGFTKIETRPLLFDSYYVSMLSEKNKKNFFWFVFGFINGFLSNLFATFSKNHSSIIYIIK